MVLKTHGFGFQQLFHHKFFIPPPVRLSYLSRREKCDSLGLKPSSVEIDMDLGATRNTPDKPFIVLNVCLFN